MSKLSRFLPVLLLASTIPTALPATAQPTSKKAEAPPPWPGPAGQYVYVEAESFTPEGAGWQVIDDPSNIFKQESASGLKLLSGAAKGDGKATRDIEVPADGNYRLWVRFVQWPKAEDNQRAPFTATIEQNGQQVLQQTYDQKLIGQPREGAVYYSDLPWAAADVALHKGPAKITLSKAGAAEVAANLRHVDALLLTTDTKYQPNDRDFGPQTYLRIHLNSATPQRVYFYMFIDHSRAPWYDNTEMDKAGLHSAVYAAEENYLQAGESTPWMNLSRLLYPDGDTSCTIAATVKYHNPDAEQSDYTLDFATAPDEKSIVKTLKRSGPGYGIQLVATPDLTGDRRPLADYEYAAETADFFKRIGSVTFGRTPTQFPVVTGLNVSTRSNGTGTYENEMAALKYMGLNGLHRRLDDNDVAQGMRFGLEGASIWFMGPGLFNEPLLDKIEASVKAEAEALIKSGKDKYSHHVILMDEAGASTLTEMAKHDTAQAAFRQWLRDQGFTPQDLGAENWDSVKIATDRKAQPPLLYLQSQRFRAWSVQHFFGQATELVRKYYPAHIPATQNYSDGAVYVGNMYSQGNDYFMWFKNKALDMAFSEDWTNGGSTRELCGWNVALMRAATKYHHQPIGLYDITSFGRAPLEVKLKAYSDIAEGAKFLEFYSYAPRYQSHELNWYHEWPMYPAVAEAAHEIGAAEHVLLHAMPRPAQTAIIYSIPYDIWNEGVDNSQAFERMHTYIALKHGQVPVDILSDDDTRTGYLKDYKVAYLFGDQLDKQSVAPLAAWVRNGGTLALSPGAGSRDELNQPSDALDKALDLQSAPVQVVQGFYSSSSYIAKSLTPKGKVHLPAANGVAAEDVDLLAQRQALTAAPNGRVLAAFEDGTPAVTVQPVGKGQVVRYGFMPALAYIHGAYNRMWDTPRKDEMVEPLQIISKAMAAGGKSDPHYPNGGGKIKRQDYLPMPYDYSAALRQIILAPTQLAHVNKPIECNTPEVEATMLEGPEGWAVPLANYSGAPVPNLQLTITPARDSGPIYSSRRGLLIAKPVAGKPISVRMPLESTDFIYAEWAKK